MFIDTHVVIIVIALFGVQIWATLRLIPIMRKREKKGERMIDALGFRPMFIPWAITSMSVLNENPIGLFVSATMMAVTAIIWRKQSRVTAMLVVRLIFRSTAEIGQILWRNIRNVLLVSMKQWTIPLSMKALSGGLSTFKRWHGDIFDKSMVFIIMK